MPIYEYECTKGHSFELLQKASEADPKTCIHCKNKVKKLISQSSFQLKGSGWYMTDYAKPSKKNDGETKTESPTCQSKPCENKCTANQKAA